ncbi:tetratricopeptide repeat protein [Woodsholea maritima]|uniref:tetratricopeptide repeat protein n=1 Tax=Woodsholea maritima TaxID=240237 RepID=UPI00037331A7|nr:tetratricopeptide repeat protein [Woodsholea maritima]
MFTRACLLALGLSSLCAPAHGELVDARLAQDGAQYNLWLIFDRPVQGVTPAGGSAFDVQGVSERARTLELYEAGELTRLQFTPSGTDQIRVTIPGGWQSAYGEVRDGAVVIALTGNGRAPSQNASSGGLPPISRPGASSSEGRSDGARDTLPMTAAARQNEAEGASEGCEATARRVQEAAWDVNGLAAHANCLLDQGNQTAATRILQQAIALEPGHFDSLYALAEIRLARGDRDGARVLYQQAFQAARGDAQAVAARRALRGLEQR